MKYKMTNYYMLRGDATVSGPLSRGEVRLTNSTFVILTLFNKQINDID